MDRCWILIGMMGAGKSTVGRSLAGLAGREFVDTDLLLQNRFGRPVAQIFEVYGEEAFRGHETSILKGLEPAPIVLATGGGIVTRPQNWFELGRLGHTIYLEASAETLIERLERSKKRRPLLETENWQDRVRSLLEQRQPLYRQAEYIVNVDGIALEDAPSRLLANLAELERS